MAQRNARAKKKVEILPPTAEQMRSGAFEISDVTDKRNGGGTITIGKAYRRVRMLEDLTKQGFFNDKQAKALAHYRNYADMCDRSIIRDSLCITRGAGNGDGPTRTQIHAEQMTCVFERAAGSLATLLREVIVNDMSLSRWVISRGLSREQCRFRKGRVSCVIEPNANALAIARLEMKMVAGWVEAELSA